LLREPIPSAQQKRIAAGRRVDGVGVAPRRGPWVLWRLPPSRTRGGEDQGDLDMGRQEIPIDPDIGPVQRFASELRRLRQEAGNPTYREMAKRTRYAVSTLSRAARGEQLPSLPVALAYAVACGGDQEEWERRWRAVSESATRDAVAADEDAAAPYQGLARFEPGDHDRFFGRDELVADLLALVREHRFTAIVGASGSGKSSLLRAGLIPALRRARGPGEPPPEGEELPQPPTPPAAIRILTPGEHPMHTHRERLVAADAADTPRDTIVLVDQFEEVFTLCRSPVERADFIDLLLAAREPGSRLRVVVAARADFFGRMAEHAQLAAAVNDSSLLVGPMSPAELRQTIIQPAQTAGLIVERALTTRILDDVSGQPGGLPLMSHALLETWLRRRGRTLTLAAYQAAGGVQGAVAATAEEVYTQLTPQHAELARRVLLRLITPGEGAQDTRRPADRTELDFADHADVGAVLERLARARLITLDGDTVDLAHEALISTWPRLRGWVDAERDRMRVHRRLTEDASAWEELERDPGGLYRGGRLGAAEEAFPAAHRGELARSERAFLTASLAARDQERRAATRATRRLRALVSALSLLLVVALTMAVVVVRQQQTAREAQQVTQSRQLAAQSDALLDTDPDLASLLAVQAYRTSPTDEATASLYHAADLGLTYRLTGHRRAVYAVAYSPDGQTLSTAALGGSVRSWDVSSGEELRALAGHEGPVRAAAMSPDRELLATVDDDGGGVVRLWDVDSGEERHALTGPERSVHAVAFSPDGELLATASLNGGVRLWDVASGEVRSTLAGRGSGVAAVAFSPDGELLATVDDDGRAVRLWDVGSGEVRRTLTGLGSLVTVVAFGPDGEGLAAGGEDGTVRLWDVGSGEVRRTLTGLGSLVTAVAFGPDGEGLAAGGEDGTVRLWDVGSGEARSTLAERDGGVGVVAFGPDGRALAVGDEDGTVRLWDVASGEVRRTLTGHGGGVTGAAFSPDGELLATAGDDGRAVRLWDVASGEARQTLTGHDGGVGVVAFSRDGESLTTSSGDARVRWWDVATGEVRETLIGHDDWEHVVAFRPDGEGLVTASSGGTVRLWDADTGEARDTLTGHAGRVTEAAFSPDGESLATGGEDGTVRLWDMATGQERRTLTGHGGGVTGLAFSPDGESLATGGEDGTVRLWDAALPDADDAVEQICRALHQDLASNEDSRRLPTDLVCPA
jgi:WD40 repeat protein/transcriptional regulator with XRE-family HTH domain